MKARFHLLASVLAVAVTLAVMSGPAAAAPATSNTGQVQLNAILNEQISITLSGATTVNFTLAPNTASNPGVGTTSVLTQWILKPGRTSVQVWAYFTTTTALSSTTGGTATIPSSAVGIQVGGVGGFTACSTVSPFNAAASGMLISNTAITPNTNNTSSRTDSLAYNIDTTVVPQLPADSYSGTLNIQAQAQP